MQLKGRRTGARRHAPRWWRRHQWRR